jgi:hypothetical protein
MMIHSRRFNIYLLVALTAGLVCGCKTAEQKRKEQISTFRVYVEVPPDFIGKSAEVEVHKDPTIKMNLANEPTMTEAYVQEAKVVEDVGGFSIAVQLNRDGSLLLENVTSSSLGRHIAIFSQFLVPPDMKPNAGRWLAVLKLSSHITDGRIVFTPDATRAEADQIVLGLNTAAGKTQPKKRPI